MMVDNRAPGQQEANMLQAQRQLGLSNDPRLGPISEADHQAYNQQQARLPGQINETVDQAQQMMEMAQHLHEMFGLEVKPGSKGPLDRIKQLEALRGFVSIKQYDPAANYDPQMQLQAIDHEIARLKAAQQPRQPIVQKAKDNQRGR